MNKYQEAFDRIMNEDYYFPNDYYGEDLATAMERDEETLQELIDRATSMRVTDIHVDEFYCPNCGSEITHDYDCELPNFCEDCGQALDWNEEE